MRVRVTGIVVEDERLLLLRQRTGHRDWSLPGGKAEDGELLSQALAREMLEETGLHVEPGRLLYVCDNLAAPGGQVLHLTFEARRLGGTVGDISAGADTTPIREVRFVPIADLPAYGFSGRFSSLARSGWPGAGSYIGPKSGIGL